MKKEFQPIIAKLHNSITLFDKEKTAEDLFTDYVGNPNKKGWCFNAGDPEFWHFADRLVIPGGRALDLGMGYGRTSLPFALRGMQVTAYETDPHAVLAMKTLRDAYNLSIDIRSEDINDANFGQERYDTVLLGQTFVHFPSKIKALKVLDKAVDAAKNGGHLWLRASGKLDEFYEHLSWWVNNGLYRGEVTRVDDDVYTAPCTCSGDSRIEPILFFEPTELIYHLNARGLNIVHSQVMPEYGRENIMYGEDWEPERTSSKVNGAITLLAQKNSTST